jgi:hypothetical protein
VRAAAKPAELAAVTYPQSTVARVDCPRAALCLILSSNLLTKSAPHLGQSLLACGLVTGAIGCSGGRAPLFRRRGLFGRRSFDVARFALLISFVQELVDHARASLLLDPSLLRFLLFSEELVIYFPAHCVLHRDRTNGMTIPQYRPQFQFLTIPGTAIASFLPSAVLNSTT